jgi:hypothetical protein
MSSIEFIVEFRFLVFFCKKDISSRHEFLNTFVKQYSPLELVSDRGSNICIKVSKRLVLSPLIGEDSLDVIGFEFGELVLEPAVVVLAEEPEGLRRFG